VSLFHFRIGAFGVGVAEVHNTGHTTFPSAALMQTWQLSDSTVLRST